MEFLRPLLGRYFAGKPLVVSQNVDCLLRLPLKSYRYWPLEDTRAILLSLLCDKILINLHIWGEFDKTSTSVATVLESENNSYTRKLRL